MRFTLALIVLALAGCTSPDSIKVEAPPQLIHVPVREYVALPAELTRDCTNETPKAQVYAEAKRLANLRDASITECNKRWARVRSLQAKPAKP